MSGEQGGTEIDSPTSLKVSGNSILSEIHQANTAMMMMPGAICGPHGGDGPILKNFLFHHDPFVHQVIKTKTDRHNATALYVFQIYLSSHPARCPSQHHKHYFVTHCW